MIRAVLIGATLAAIPAAAQARGDLRSLVVEAADLDLSTDAGVVELEHRVRRAVDRICDGDRECREGAWASTEAQVYRAIAKDQAMRRLAAERLAELRACGGRPCAMPGRAYYPVQPSPAVTVTVTYCPPPVYYRQ